MNPRAKKKGKVPSDAQRDTTARMSKAMRQAREAPTRAAVARRLGKSVGGVRFQEGKALHPWQDADGVWRFDPAEVEALAAQLEARARIDTPTELSPGKLAARACQLFRDGKSVVDVVIALEQPFDVVQPLYRAFIEDSRAMHVPAAMVERIATACEVDQLTPEIVLQELEANSRKLAELSASRHGASLSKSESERKTKR